ncbi:NEDD8-activating enzyme E1 regulatory subunit [Schistosoma japonicum]|nr:NEDD8-activating enzyme E1 regulatory subunit [Schistosoma japonicum]
MNKRGERERRYDRQLRLWGDHGQFSIENAKVCLLRAEGLGAEILKNLVLPGVGSFTIIDDSHVTENDLGSNFFVTENHIGRARAQVVTECLMELNNEVNGNYLIEDVQDLLEKDPHIFFSFDVVIVTDAREKLLIHLSQLLNGTPITLVVCFSVGVIGFLRICTPEHVIVESHPDSYCPDLRLDRPLSNFVKMANEQSLEEMTSEKLSHTPWLIIVYVFVQKFISLHGHFPRNHKEKAEVKDMISKGAVELWTRLRERENNLDSSYVLENFQEACQAVNTAVSLTTIPENVKMLLEDDRCDDPCLSNTSISLSCSSNLMFPAGNRELYTKNPVYSTISTVKFWRLVRALRDFIEHEGEGQLPVRGSLPDMISDSQRYLQLLSIYRERSEWAVERIASRLLQFPDISIDDVRLFVKNASFLNIVRCRSLEEEMRLSPARSDDLALIPTHEENDSMLWYLVLRGACSFLMETGRWPGSSQPYTTKRKPNYSNQNTNSCSNSVSCEDQYSDTHSGNLNVNIIESDLPTLRIHLNRVLQSFGIAPNRVSTDYLEQVITRC